jgi:glutamine synthetase
MPVTLSANELAEHGVTELLPKSLAESLAALRADSMTEAVLGPRMKKRYLEVKGKDEEVLKTLSEEGRRALYVRYF